MSTATMSYGMRARERMPFAWDFATLGVTAALLLVGIVMVTSASMSIAAKDFTDPFYFLERQFIFAMAGLALAWGMTRFPTELWHKYSLALLVVALLLLVLVPPWLVPPLWSMANRPVRMKPSAELPTFCRWPALRLSVHWKTRPVKPNAPPWRSPVAWTQSSIRWPAAQ